jgi:hypothetical protein
MMSMFDHREESFEKTFVHEEELHFLAEARRNKLLGLWAVEELGATGRATVYVEKLVTAVTATNADDIVINRVMKEFAAAGVRQSELRCQAGNPLCPNLRVRLSRP